MFLKRIFEEVPVVKAEPEKPQPWEEKVVSVPGVLCHFDPHEISLIDDRLYSAILRCLE